MGMLKIVEWADYGTNRILYKFDLKNDVVKKGTALTVRESQVAVFCDKGRIADIFTPGAYKMDTESLPLFSRLLNFKYGFAEPFKSDIYFINTKLFTDCKWGTPNPVIVRDPQLGTVRIRAFGSYAFKVSDPREFLTKLSGTNADFYKQEITGYIKSILLMGLSDALGGCNLPLSEMTGNLIALSDRVKKVLEERFSEMGLEISTFNIENLSLPPELEKALDENTRLSMLKGNAELYVALKQADALESAAKNNASLGALAGAGVGIGVGAALSKKMTEVGEDGRKCPHCNEISSSGKFCSHCGKPLASVCSGCGAALGANAKFCGECGKPVITACPSCGAKIPTGAKFCGECGHKV